MRRRLGLICAALVVAAVSWLGAQNAATVKPLAEILPSGALVYLEARNLGGLLGEWNGSAQKKTWLGSANYRVFSRSRLFLRLQQVFEEYAGGVGLTPDMNLLASVAGGESALVIYDISKLEALYVTRLANARALESVLWKAKDTFSERRAGGTQVYYAKTDPVSRRTACFAIAGDLLLLSTREEALTGALGLLSNAAGAGTAVGREPWFLGAVQAQAAVGEVRMVANMESLVREPSFRSYWIQNNVGELRPFRAAIADLTRTAGEMREQRTLLRGEPLTAAPDAAAVPGLLRIVADNPGLFQVWAQPEAGEAASLVANRLLRPGPRVALQSNTAPGVSLDPYAVGSEADLEARLDAAPYDPPGAIFKLEPVAGLFGGNRPVAMLLSQTIATPAGAVFPSSDTVIAVQAVGNWNAGAVRQALAAAIESLHTTGRIGVEWRERRVGNETVAELDGLAPLAFAVKGSLLVIGTRGESVAAAVARAGGAAAGEPAVYAAGYRTTAADRGTYTRLTRMIEFPGGIPAVNDVNAEPAFFSQNLSSLLGVLQRVQSASVTARDDGRLLRQTVVYRLSSATP